MCGLLTITPKSASRASRNERKHENPKTPSPNRHTLIEARVQAIMGTPSVCRAPENLANAKAGEERSEYSPSEKPGEISLSVDRGELPSDRSKFHENRALRTKSFPNLKYEARRINSAGCQSSHPRTRPRLYERGKYPSSPLANIGIGKADLIEWSWRVLSSDSVYWLHDVSE